MWLLEHFRTPWPSLQTRSALDKPQFSRLGCSRISGHLAGRSSLRNAMSRTVAEGRRDKKCWVRNLAADRCWLRRETTMGSTVQIALVSLSNAHRQIHTNLCRSHLLFPWFPEWVTNWIIFFFGATAPIWALAYLHETLRFTSVF
jgi:hypothetical protein